MKRIIFLAATLIATGFSVQAQGIKFGLKAGANFANFTGDLDSDGITSFHAGGVLELNLVPTFSIQGEALYSSQGGKAVYDNGGAVAVAKDFDLDYIAVPVLAKYYILPKRLSIMAGPQFSFLVKEAEEEANANSFDMAAAGGVELRIISGLFAQARYTVGLNDVYDNIKSKNTVFQLSLGYMF